MLPIRGPDCIFDRSSNEHPEFDPYLLPNSACFPTSTPAIFCPDGFHDLFLASDVGIANATPASARPSLPLGDSATSVERPEGDDGCSRTRALRKCRHSKIVTANGPRDRRMRLSIDVARSFFRLQDTLGFDKASKTVRWLLTMSKAAIEELGTLSSAELCACGDQSQKSKSSAVPGSKNKSAAAGEAKKSKARKRAVRPARKAEGHSALARESRAKARARARERTREKRRMTTSLDAIKEETSLNSLMGFARMEEGESCAPDWCLNVAGDTGYEVPMIGGPVLIPVFENRQDTAAIDDAGGIFEQRWDVDALSLYSTSLLGASDSYPNL